MFFAEAPTSRYTAARAYVLTVGERGLLMAETAVPSSTHAFPIAAAAVIYTLEENNVYESRARDSESAPVWFWQRLTPGETLQSSLTLPARPAADVRLRLHLWGGSEDPQREPDHTLAVTVNGRSLTTLQWDGIGHHEADVTIPLAAVGDPQLSIELHNETAAAGLDLIWVDRLMVTATLPVAVIDKYPYSPTGNGRMTLPDETLLLDVQEPSRPQLLRSVRANGGNAVAVSADMKVWPLHETALQTPVQLSLMQQADSDWALRGADLLIVADAAWQTALAPLVQARTAAGLRVVILSPAQIVDVYGDGAVDPAAMQTFLAQAAAEWPPPAPRYLLLVGDASWDFRGYLAAPPPGAILPLLTPVTYGGETVSDARLADWDGDGRPDLAIGRWPVRSARQVTQLVQRTLAYEAETAAAAAVMIADGENPAFARLAADLAQLARPAQERIGMAMTPPAAWPEAWLGAYVGHGSLSQWGQARLMDAEAVDAVAARMPPILLQFTCLTGLFAHPERPSLAEVMLLDAEGPVLVAAATSLTLSHQQAPFARELVTAVRNPAHRRMGDAWLAAQQQLDLSAPGQQEIIDTFVLLGDPSATVRRPANP